MNVRAVASIGLLFFAAGASLGQDAGQEASKTSTTPPLPSMPSGSIPWPYEYMRGDIVIPCPDDESTNCIWHRLIVDNLSSDTLVCRGRATYDGVNRGKLADAERLMVLMPHSRRAVFADTTTPDVNVKAHSLECAVRTPPDESKLTLNCKPTILLMPSEATYPIASRLAAEEGPVLVEFSLSNKEDAPTDIKVVGSSLWPKLDESGIKYVSQFRGYTDCKTGRFRIPVSFRLQ